MTEPLTDSDWGPPLLTRRPRPGEQVLVRIDGVTAEGLGRASVQVGRGEHQPPRRYVLQVRGALPGELVEAEIGARRGHQLIARARRLLSRCEARIEARCAHFEQMSSEHPGCGGCGLQSLAYTDQLALKRERVQRLIQQVGFAAPLVAAPIGQSEPWYYRNKMEYTFYPRRDGRVILGLHPSGSRQVLELHECHLLSAFASSLLPKLSGWVQARGLTAYWPARDSGFLRTLTIREGKRTGERLVELTTSADQHAQTTTGSHPAADVAQSFARWLLAQAKEPDQQITSIHWTRHVSRRGHPTEFVTTLLHGSPVLHETLQLPGGRLLHFEIHPRAFFQPATLQAERLYAEVMRSAGLIGQPGSFDVLDLYCGTGTIGLCLAHACRQVIGIELRADAVENARRNALHNSIDNATFVSGDVGAVLATGSLTERLRHVGVVVVDPPRAGLMPPALAHIQAIGAPTLVYVSCNPEALARDLLELARFGYRVQAIQPVDMFPQTAHIECVARLVRGAPAAGSTAARQQPADRAH